MSIDEIIKQIDRWAKDFERKVEQLEQGLDKRVAELQRKLLEELKQIIEWLELDGKTIKNTPGNIRQLNRMDGLMDRFQRDYINTELRAFAEEIVGVGRMTVGYYEALGQVVAADQILDMIRNVIGVDQSGNLLRGGYLDKLGRSDEVRGKLRDYVLQSVIQKRSLSAFQRGLKDLVVGNTETEGALQKYWRQYAYDVFNSIHEIANTTIADQLELKYFIYQGSIIENTRQFCRKRAGKVFSVEETKDWKNDPDLIDKKTKEQYNPLVDRGRYNCRHFLNYISDEVAAELKKQ